MAEQTNLKPKREDWEEEWAREDRRANNFVLAVISICLLPLFLAIAFMFAEGIGHVNGIHQGTVTEKVYTAGHWPQWCIDSYGINNVEGSCAGQYEQPSWKLTITKGEDENTFNVTEGQFNRTAEGATATFDKDDNLMENQ
jgi:hypothetical protein